MTVVEARLYSRPTLPVPIFGAAMTEQTASFVGSWADGLLISGHEPKAVAPLVAAFRQAGGEGKPVHLQMAVSLASSDRKAEEEALDQWSAAAIGGDVNLDLRRPADFDLAARTVSPNDIRRAVLVTSSTNEIVETIASFADLSIDVVHLHQFGRSQVEFIKRVGTDVLPAL